MSKYLDQFRPAIRAALPDADGLHLEDWGNGLIGVLAETPGPYGGTETIWCLDPGTMELSNERTGETFDLGENK